MSASSPIKAPLAIEDKSQHEQTTSQPLAVDMNASNDDDEGVTTIEVDGEPIKLDKLGPMIINSDGTMSRIVGWHDLSQIERDRTIRLLVRKRNIERMKAVAARNGGSGDKVSALKDAA